MRGDYSKPTEHAMSSDPRRKVDLGLVDAEHVAFDAVEMLDVLRQVGSAGITAEFIDGCTKSLEQRFMRHEPALDHRIDIGLIVCTEWLELADYHVDHVQHEQLQLFQPSVHRIDGMQRGPCGRNGTPFATMSMYSLCRL